MSEVALISEIAPSLVLEVSAQRGLVFLVESLLLLLLLLLLLSFWIRLGLNVGWV
jgi:hypothetical protein